MTVGVSETTDRFSLDIAVALQRAFELKLRVVVILRGDLSAGREARMIEGVPVAFPVRPDGRSRVLLEVVPGESAQVVLVERIARVTFAARA